jgi:Protein of unknown function (DUF2910).
VSPELLATLAGLALLDSLSVGTLLIPVVFLIAPRLRAGRMLLYLATIALFYLAAGVALLLGAGGVLTLLGDGIDSPVTLWIQLVLGVALLVGSFLVPTKPREGAEDAAPGRVARWRDAALHGPRAVVVIGVAVAAGLLEVATMLPYLGAIGLLTTSETDPATRILLLAGYCVVMVVPALVLLVVRVVARPLVEAPLARFAAWLERTGPETTAWIVGIVGFLLARDAAAKLGLFAGLGSFLDRL